VRSRRLQANAKALARGRAVRAMRSYDRRRLNLLREIAMSQFKLRDQSTLFGFVWSFLNPLLMLTVLFAFFSASAGKGIEHYGIYLLIGIVHYTHFSNGTNSSMHVLVSGRALTADTVFPKELLVIGSVIASSVEFVLSMLVVGLIALLSGVDLKASAAMLPAVLVLQIMLVLWVSILLSCVYVYVRDISHIYQVLLRTLLFITPVFYDLRFVGSGLARYIVLVNPLTHLIQFSRDLVLTGRPFSGAAFVLLFLGNVVMLGVAIAAFRKLEPTFAEYV
jgi:lipopolysaccharide transport system permease protein